MGLYRTGSFGSALQLGAGFGYMLVTSLVSGHGAGSASGSCSSPGWRPSWWPPSSPPPPTSTGPRPRRSRASRRHAWTRAPPPGSIPGGTTPELLRPAVRHRSREQPGARPAHEAHRPAHRGPQRTVVVPGRRGFIGFAGLVLLWATLWRLARPRGVARAMLCGYLLASVFRETLALPALVGLPAAGHGARRAVEGPRRDPRRRRPACRRPRWWRSVDRAALRAGGAAARGLGRVHDRRRRHAGGQRPAEGRRRPFARRQGHVRPHLVEPRLRRKRLGPDARPDRPGPVRLRRGLRHRQRHAARHRHRPAVHPVVGPPGAGAAADARTPPPGDPHGWRWPAGWA